MISPVARETIAMVLIARKLIRYASWPVIGSDAVYARLFACVHSSRFIHSGRASSVGSRTFVASKTTCEALVVGSISMIWSAHICPLNSVPGAPPCTWAANAWSIGRRTARQSFRRAATRSRDARGCRHMPTSARRPRTRAAGLGQQHQAACSMPRLAASAK